MPPSVRWLPAIATDVPAGEQLLGQRHPHNPLVRRMLDGDETAAAELTARYDDMASIWTEWTAGHAAHYVSSLEAGLGHVSTRGRILELAAGTGAGTRVIVAGGRDVTAIEPVTSMIREIGAVGARLVQASSFALPFADGSFDLLVGLNAVMSANEAERVLGRNGAILWCYSFAEDTPVYVAPDVLSAHLRRDAVAQRVGPGMWVLLTTEHERP